MKWFDRVWSEREGMVKQRDRDGIKEAFCQYIVFKKGTQCKRSRLVGEEEIKLTIIREKWLQIKKYLLQPSYTLTLTVPHLICFISTQQCPCRRVPHIGAHGLNTDIFILHDNAPF